jgi:hypothetical protein
MNMKYACLIAVSVLAGCVTETTKVSSGPLTGADAEVYNLAVNAAIDVAIADTISDDCPRLRYNSREERVQLKAVADKATALLDGDVERAAAIVDRLVLQNSRDLLPQAEAGLLAYIKANDYIPGSAATACRVGNEERRNGSAIGRLLIAE